MDPSKTSQNFPEAARVSAEKSASIRQGKARKEPSVNKRVRKQAEQATRETRRKARASQPSPVDIDWYKYTHFRSRNSAKDLERLHRLARRNLFDANEPDKTGLWPIHWAAINNRSDMIEFMLKNGSRVDKQCKNRFFANGTPLHLASMNGALEAADVLISRGSGNHNEQQSREKSDKAAPREQSAVARAGVNLLSLRDADGQTPLMRSAAPRSKRMDTVRDLLRKNNWSLSGRPAEMALLLICRGAKWRETEPHSGMNLMHLAIVNDYDDIVSLLLVLDRQLLDVAAANFQPGRNEQPLLEEPRVNMDAVDGFETIDLSDRPLTLSRRAAPSDMNSQVSPSPTTPLIDKSSRAQQMVARGLKPLQLAILFGRVAIISRLWHAREREKYLNSVEGSASLRRTGAEVSSAAPLNVQKTAVQGHSLDRKQLKSILYHATWSNRGEFATFLKAFLLKGIVALDLMLVALFWAPLYAGIEDFRWPLTGFKGGIFLLSFCITMALTLRVTLRNPGYLRRNSVQYLDQMSRLMQAFTLPDESPTPAPPTKPLIRLDSSSPESSQASRESSQSSALTPKAQAQPLIETIKQPVVDKRDPAAKEVSQQTQPDDTNQTQREADRQRLQIVQIELAKQAPSWESRFDLKDTVRLLCHKCQCVRRPRSRHCNYCNHCVQDFDHHCIYLGCCVGRQNRVDFLLTLIMMTITGLYGTFLIFSSTFYWYSSYSWIIGFIWIFKWVLIGLLLAFQNLRRACLGVTLYEEIRSKRLRHLFGRLGPSEEISKSHRGFSTLKGSFWRYDPDRFLTGDQSSGDILEHFNEFRNYISCDEYLLSFICTDTPVARAIASSDSRINITYKLH